MKKCLRAVALLGALALTACSFSKKTRDARSALDANNPQAALAEYNAALEVDSAAQLPADPTGDNALLILDRSLVLQQLGEFKHSSRDLEVADKEVQMLDFARRPAHEIGRYLFSDDVGPYKARPYEKLMINTLNMVNYLARQNLSGAKVEARRLAIMQKYLGESEEDPTEALLGPGSYLAGFVFEQAGNFGEALRYYDEALRFASYESLRGPVQRAATLDGYRTERLEALLDAEPPADDDERADLLIVVSYGRVPALEATRIPVGLALTIAGDQIETEQRAKVAKMQAQGLVTWVNYPRLGASASNYPAPSIQVDGESHGLDGETNVTTLVRQSWDSTKGTLVASALVRTLARAAAGAGVGLAVARAGDSGKKGSKKQKTRSILGLVAALGTQAALTAADTPDTRSWATLPGRIGFVRLRLPAGKHTVRASALGTTVEREVELQPGGWSVVNLTALRGR